MKSGIRWSKAVMGFIVLGGLALVVSMGVATATSVTVSGRQLRVNGQTFIVKGVGYSPTPICDDPKTSPNGDYFTAEYRALYERDLPLMRQMGVNTIRLWSWVAGRDHSDFLSKAYNNGVDPIYVIIPFDFSGEITNSASRTLIKSRFRNQVAAYKSYPAVLMWALGNELNSAAIYGGNPDAGGNLTNFFSLVNELAAEAHAEEGTNAHPVTVPLADENVIQTISAFNSLVTNLDVWSIQPYRGGTFGTLFSQYAAASTKPLVLTEFGVDAFDNTADQEYELVGTAQQAVYTGALWDEIAANSAVCAGGCVMEYRDEWWKGTQGRGDWDV
ncbi:MAG: hypothetical protein V2A34_04750, partial [Lentisphaerota bacterium]